MTPKVYLDAVKYETARERVGDSRGRGLTHTEIAAGVGISRASLDYLRRGKFSPSPETMARLAQFLGTSLDGLFTIRESPN